MMQLFFCPENGRPDIGLYRCVARAGSMLPEFPAAPCVQAVLSGLAASGQRPLIFDGFPWNIDRR
jgi:hypothetical protein